MQLFRRWLCKFQMPESLQWLIWWKVVCERFAWYYTDDDSLKTPEDITCIRPPIGHLLITNGLQNEILEALLPHDGSEAWHHIEVWPEFPVEASRKQGWDHRAAAEWREVLHRCGEEEVVDCGTGWGWSVVHLRQQPRREGDGAQGRPGGLSAVEGVSLSFCTQGVEASLIKFPNHNFTQGGLGGALQNLGLSWPTLCRGG